MDEDTSRLLYFAYGANMHPALMGNFALSAELKGIAMLPKFRLAFSLAGRHGDARCNIEKTMDLNDVVYGTLYRIEYQEIVSLEHKLMQNHGVSRCKLTVMSYRKPVKVFSFFTDPPTASDKDPAFSWYKQMVLMGALYHRFPESYINAIRTRNSILDPDAKRRQSKEELLNKITTYGV